MGEVYRARHTVLGRQVALKTVQAQAADESAKRRLVREARNASLLAHPNICTIFEVGEADGTPFIVMELVDGVSLKERATPRLNDAVSIGCQIAAALEHAHQHGIIHRDLKSSNVAVDAGGKAVVLDFGLARRLPQLAAGLAGDSTLTVSGALAGTLGYMAPEILRGDDADARSDIWSLGVLLYELVTSQLPFSGRTQFETSSAILGEPPQDLRRVTPFALRLVVERCLSKEPEARYQSAAEVRDALDSIKRRRAWPLVGRLLVSMRRRSLAGWTAAALLVVASVVAAPWMRAHLEGTLRGRVSTLAVLPIETSATDSVAQYYAHGITEGLIGRLGSMTDARILAPASAALVARTAASRMELAQRLHADAIAEGRLRKASGRIVVDIRLVEPIRGRVIWSDTYERTTRQVLALEDDIVRALAAEVRLTIRSSAREQIATPRAVNPGAYESYLRGRFEWNKRTKQSLERAVAHFETAVDLDPTYAPAHAALADCYNQFGTQLLGTGSPSQYRPRAASEAVRALQIDPFSAEAHAALGYVRHYDWQWADAEQEFRRAIELNPSYPLAHLWYANLLMSRGRFDEALAQVYLARDLDPFSLIINTNIGWVLSVAHRPLDAIAQLRQTLALDSTYVQAHTRLIDPLVALRQFDAARREAEFVIRKTGTASALAGLALMDAKIGRASEARSRLDTVLTRERTEYVPPAAIAAVYAALGDTVGQDRWLDLAVREHSNAIAYLMVDDHLWRRDAQFMSIARQAGLR
jgi:serine/threonine-protein kinase